ncbi:MAG: 1-acyl-sn-glycerol-3-phosphate acyltransferase [Firmicutes bacterium]|nr:1-acyl-sn-glycerol-3-phosphate acyltransferase [Bacillota bacterium]
MNRIVLMVMKNIVKVPGMYAKLCHYAKHNDEYSEAEKYAHIRHILTLGVKSGNIDMQIFGEENVPKEGGLLLYSNHQGLFDVVAAVVACETPISAVYKKEIEGVPFIKQIATCLKGLAMDRKNPRQSLEVIQTVTKEVMAGRRYIIFPEGTRSKLGNKMIDFHAGSFRCAVKAKCPIQPIAMVDTYKVFDQKNSKTVSCQLHFLPVIKPEEFEGMKAGEVAEMVKARIQETLDKYAEV